MLSKAKFASTAVFAFVLVLHATTVLGQLQPELPVGTKIKVKPQLAATPEKQIAHARAKMSTLKTIDDPVERFTAMLETMSNLSFVAQKWPDATDAILESALLQADLATQYSMPANAISALDAALPKSYKTIYHVRVERALARAYARLDDKAGTERHLLAAEASPMLHRINPVEASGALRDLAMFYSRGGNHREAVKRWRAAAHLPGQTAERKASLLLSALKDAVRMSDDTAERAEAKAIAREVEHAVAAARKQQKPGSRTADHYDADLARLRKQYAL